MSRVIDSSKFKSSNFSVDFNMFMCSVTCLASYLGESSDRTRSKKLEPEPIYNPDHIGCFAA